MPQSHDVSLLDEERYRLLVDAITDYAIYMIDANGRVVSWNPGAQRFKGYEPEEIIGQRFSRFFPEEARAAGLPQKALSIAAAEGKFEQEGWRVRQDGTRLCAHVVIYPVRDATGNLLGFGKISPAITAKRAAHAALI